LLRDGQPVEFTGEGNGPLAALVHGFNTAGVPRFEIKQYSEHALSSGEEAAAIAYIQLKHSDGRVRWGAGVDTNNELASGKAELSALTRSSDPSLPNVSSHRFAHSSCSLPRVASPPPDLPPWTVPVGA